MAGGAIEAIEAIEAIGAIGAIGGPLFASTAAGRFPRLGADPGNPFSLKVAAN